MSKLVGAGSYRDWEVQVLRNDRALAIEVAKLAVDSLNDPAERGGGLLALCGIAEAYGGMSAVAAQAGISRESLYRSLSPKGNPTLKTLIAVLNAVGLRLSVVEKKKKPAKAKTRRTSPRASGAA